VGRDGFEPPKNRVIRLNLSLSLSLSLHIKAILPEELKEPLAGGGIEPSQNLNKFCNRSPAYPVILILANYLKI